MEFLSNNKLLLKFVWITEYQSADHSNYIIGSPNEWLTPVQNSLTPMDLLKYSTITIVITTYSVPHPGHLVNGISWLGPVT